MNTAMNALWVGNLKKYNPTDLKSLIGKLYDHVSNTAY